MLVLLIVSYKNKDFAFCKSKGMALMDYQNEIYCIDKEKKLHKLIYKREIK